MALYSTIAALSQTAASNAADGTTDAPSTIDNNMNLLASFIARTRDGDLNTPAGVVASGATVVLDGQPGTVEISGTTTITAFTLASGSCKRLRFSAALTLTHNASIILPAGVSIKTVAGDYATFVGRGGGVVECLGYQHASPSLASAGFYRLPGGLTVQWGSVTTTAAGAAVTFPTPYLNGIFSVTLAPQTSASIFTTYQTLSGTGFFAQGWTSNTGVQTSVFATWMALGY